MLMNIKIWERMNCFNLCFENMTKEDNMGKWFSWTLKIKELVILKHSLETKIQNRKEQINIAKSCKEYSSELEQLQKDLIEEQRLYNELSEKIEKIREQFN